MKTLGLIGGTTWHSTIEYYKHLNSLTRIRTDRDLLPNLILYSINFNEMVAMEKRDDWDGIASHFSGIARTLENAGAEGLLLCANTTHKVADTVQQSIKIPLLNMIEAVAAEVEKKGIKKVGLLGTRYTMEGDFYQKKLLARGIETIVPEQDDRESIDNAISIDFALGDFPQYRKDDFLRIIDDLNRRGAGGVILGCTEIPILLSQSDTEVPLFDSTLIHVNQALDFALAV
jgi:aspartate racemase